MIFNGRPIRLKLGRAANFCNGRGYAGTACLKSSRKPAVERIVGIGVPLELSSLCVVDAPRGIAREVAAAGEPDAIAAVLHGLKLQPVRVGSETGLLSQSTPNGLDKAGFQTSLLNARFVAKAAFSPASANGRQNARGIAELLCGSFHATVDFYSLMARSWMLQLLVALLEVLGCRPELSEGVQDNPVSLVRRKRRP